LASPRRRAIAIAVAIVVVVLLFSLRSLAVLWTDELWFSSLGISSVFSTLLEVKVGLGVTFGVAFFLVLFANLLLADRFGARDLGFDDDDEMVRRFQDLVRPYSRRIYAVIAIVVGAIGGLTATGQWNNYLLFANARSFGKKDPLFHKDLGFYIFRLPFLSFIVNWALASLAVIIVITALVHYLNGGIRTTRGSTRVAPNVKVHLSVLLAAVAVVKALGYVIAKWQLVTSGNGYVEGAGYADVHARIPALTILCFLSLAAAVILLYNIRARGWSLPALALGLWLVVALAIGVAYPALLQTFSVSPDQKHQERPYIQDNINATRSAFDLNDVKIHQYAAASTITPQQVAASAGTLNNIRLWDPSANIALETVQRRQAIRGYYTFTTLGVDRYILNGKVTPVLIGARQLYVPGLPSNSWLNQHLVYTHGNGAAILAANQVDSSTGNPIFAMDNVPPVSSEGLPRLTNPGIFFGINMNGWVVANSQQQEIDYERVAGHSNGAPVESHYKGTGGVAIGGFLRQAAFALRFGDYKLLVSNQITSKSRIIFVRDVTAMAQKAAPFLSWDAHPYAVVADGHVKFILDGYTTTSEYPYSEDAFNENVPSDNGLPASYNYVRNSVKLVVDAYDGSMKFYAADPSDPILQAYRAAFPKMFLPMSDMPAAVRAHLRYPPDLFAIQAATLGRYHIKSASPFFVASDRWEVSPTAGAGDPKTLLRQTKILNASGQQVGTVVNPMDPLYQVMSLPGSSRQQLVVESAYVPFGNTSTVQGLTAFITATSDPDDYGQINVYTTPGGSPVLGPAQADSEMIQSPTVSQKLTLLNQQGSKAILGNNLLIPLNNAVLYIRPLYVTSSSNSLPQLKYVIALFDQKVSIEPTLAQALTGVLGSSGGVTPPPSGGKSVKYYLAQAQAAYSAAQSDLAHQDLAGYQREITLMNHDVLLAQSALSKSK
jgi:uncharacterized membrane protein (UPF0182 family)